MTISVGRGLYIEGSWVPPDQRATQAVVNPANEEILGFAPVGSRAQIDQAIAAATTAFTKGPWPRLSTRARVAKLEEMLGWLQSQSERIIDLIVKEAGATHMYAAFLHYSIPMKHARGALEEALRISSEMTPLEISPSFDGRKVLGTAVTEHEPVGVVAAITPYNFPYFLNIGKVFPALVMGNCVVLKPSPFTPFEALILGEAADAVALPKGVLNIVTGDIEAGALMTTDPRVDLVTFTGSDRVGAAIMAQGSPTLKRMVLELGGKSAQIVRADADIMLAAQAGLASFTVHCGQGCALTTRHLVHNSIRKQYVEVLSGMASQVKVGDPSDPTVGMGPLIRAAARTRVEHYVAEGLRGGATLAFGGKRPDALSKGFFYLPTLFDDVENQSAIAQEEIFGPVACVIGFDSDEQAIEMANASDFGLYGAVFSADAGHAYEMARRIRTGGVSINGGSGTMLSAAPFGGIKRSGMGREYGRQGLLEFTYAKSISFHAA
jgi:aldehyde dehydrogenase (NAD+)